MTRNVNLVGWRVLAIAVVVITLALPGLPAAVAQAPSIRVGQSTDLSGPNALPGEGDRKGTVLAMEEINAAGGIAGRKVELFFADHRSSPAEVISAIRKLADLDRVDVIMGSGASGTTLASMPVIKEVGVAQVTHAATNPRIRDQAGRRGGNLWQFRINVDDTLIALAYISLIVDSGAKRVALMAYGDDFGRGAVASYTPLLQRKGVTIVGTEYFTQGQADFRPLLTRVRNERPDAVIVIIQVQDAVTFVRQMREVGLNVPVFGRGQLISIPLIRAFADNPKTIEGLMDATFWAPGVDPAFDKKYQDRWGEPAVINAAMAYYSLRYVISEALRIATSRGGITRQSVRDALEQVSVDTPIGPIDFDEWHQGHPDVFVVQIRDGKIVIAHRIPSRLR